MDITVMILGIVMGVYIVYDLIKGEFKRRWYRKGYVEAALKYDESEFPPNVSYSDEADRLYHDKYDFKYD